MFSNHLIQRIITLSATFDLTALIPVVILIAVSALIPTILSILRLKFIPVFVIEILAGIIIGVFNKSGIFSTNLMAGLYAIGMTFLLFLSGLDTDFSVLNKTRKGDGNNINAFKLSIILMIAVIVLSLAVSFGFMHYMNEGKKVEGVFLLTICLSSTFASIVIPIIHEQHFAKTTIGQIICTYSTISEFLSIVLLSGYMIVNEINHDQKPWLLIIALIILLITYVVKRFVIIDRFRNTMDGIVHLSLRLAILVLLTLMIITEKAGAEYILGAFLAGMVIRAAKISKHTMEKIEVVGYGLFIPMFYILVGVKIPIVELVTNPEYILLIIGLFLVLILVKLPFMILFKWYYKETVLPTMFLITCTIIVSIALEHFHVFSHEFISCLIVASALTCLIPPIIFEANSKFDVCRQKYVDVILEPHEVAENQE